MLEWDHQSGNRPIWGVLGGMGPLASNTLLTLIYQKSYPCTSEQSLPVIVLRSVPDFPDRSTMLLSDAKDILAARLTLELESLLRSGAKFIVICCYALHSVISTLSSSHQKHVVSLTEIAIQRLRISRPTS